MNNSKHPRMEPDVHESCDEATAMNENIKLFIDFRQEETVGISPETFAWLEGADALVIDPRRCTFHEFEHMPVEDAAIINGDPERDASWREVAGHWVDDQGLESAARLRDLYPSLSWIPKLNLFRAQVSYRFSGPAIGEGFSFYIPDTAAIHGWRVDGADLTFREILTRATELGFSALWLHSPEAASRGVGLDLDLLEKARGGPLEIWLSGGVTEARHLQNLSRAGGAAAVSVDAALARRLSMQALRMALAPEPSVRPEAVPVHFDTRQSQAEQG